MTLKMFIYLVFTADTLIALHNFFVLVNMDCLLLSKYRDLLLPIHTKINCCEHVRHVAAAQIADMKLPIADLYMWSWERWRVAEEL